MVRKVRIVCRRRTDPAGGWGVSASPLPDRKVVEPHPPEPYNTGVPLEEYGSSLDWKWDPAQGRWVKVPGWWKEIPADPLKGSRGMSRPNGRRGRGPRRG